MGDQSNTSIDKKESGDLTPWQNPALYWAFFIPD
jgi:hypothetical protein